MKLVTNIAEEWDKAAPVIERALDYGGGSLPEIKKALEAGKAQLWADSLGAYAITLVNDSLRGKMLQIYALAGDGLDAWGSRAVGGWESYARAHGCKWIYANGRAGWRREFRRHGFTVTHLTGVKEV